MLFELFTIFLKIGAFTIGGGFAMIPIIQKELVDNKGWIEEKEFLDAIGICQGSPGPIAVNISIYIGYKIKGIKGALVCVLGTILPSFFIMLLISTVFFKFRNNHIIERVFLGIRPAVVALILSAVYSFAKIANCFNMKIIISVFVVLAIVLLKINPIYLILLGGFGFIIMNKVEEYREG